MTLSNPRSRHTGSEVCHVVNESLFSPLYPLLLCPTVSKRAPVSGLIFTNLVPKLGSLRPNNFSYGSSPGNTISGWDLSVKSFGRVLRVPYLSVLTRP